MARDLTALVERADLIKEIEYLQQFVQNLHNALRAMEKDARQMREQSEDDYYARS